MESKITSSSDQASICINDLTFSYPESTSVIRNLSFQLHPGNRLLLIGSNGSGKSTLLRILAGRHLFHPDEAITVLSRNPFRDTQLNFERAYLDTEWGMRTVAFAGYGVPLQADMAVSEMMVKLQAQFPERRETLINLLSIDVAWRMHKVSDGQRRRVQLFLALLRPFKILLLDEVTVSLDVLVRQDLLGWLKLESETRHCTIIYATHIFDGLDDWASHLLFLRNLTNSSKDMTSLGWFGRAHEVEMDERSMLKIAMHWLREEVGRRETNREPVVETGLGLEFEGYKPGRINFIE